MSTERITLLEKEIQLLRREMELVKGEAHVELQKVSGAFGYFSQTIDMIYLQLVTLLDVLSENNIISEEGFKKALEITSAKMQKEMEENSNKKREEQSKLPKQ